MRSCLPLLRSSQSQPERKQQDELQCAELKRPCRYLVVPDYGRHTPLELQPSYMENMEPKTTSLAIRDSEITDVLLELQIKRPPALSSGFG